MMFKARHDELLEHVFFSGPTEPRSDDGLQVVEMWKYEGVCEPLQAFEYTF